MAQLEFPTTLWYHSHASGFIGSPTLPRTTNDLRLCLQNYENDNTNITKALRNLQL